MCDTPWEFQDQRLSRVSQMGQLVEGDNYRKMAKNWPKWPKLQNQHFGGKSKGRQSPQSPLRTAKNYMEIPYKFFLNTPEKSSFFLTVTPGISTAHAPFSKPLGIPCPHPPPPLFGNSMSSKCKVVAVQVYVP